MISIIRNFFRQLRGLLVLIKAEWRLLKYNQVTVDERKAICEACECYDFGRCSTDKCPGSCDHEPGCGCPKACGCGCILWAKVRDPTQYCPRGKW